MSEDYAYIIRYGIYSFLSFCFVVDLLAHVNSFSVSKTGAPCGRFTGWKFQNTVLLQTCARLEEKQFTASLKEFKIAKY